MLERADFHVHLGDRTYKDLIDEALANQVKVMAVLDRGIVRISKLRYLIKLGRKSLIKIIPGVECLTEVPYEGKTIHQELLSLDFDLSHPEIFKYFDPGGEVYSQKHHGKVEFQKSFLENEGLSLNSTAENLRQWKVINSGEVLDTAVRLCKIAAADPANKDYFLAHQEKLKDHLIKRPQDSDNLEAKYLYWEFFAAGQKGFRRWQLDYQTIISTIHKAGGVVIIPHPTFRHKPNGIEITKLFDTLLSLGVDGVEGWDADLLNRDLASYALNKEKLILGGSGRDATYYSNRVVGKGDIKEQRMYISPRRLQDIRRYKQKFGLTA